MPPRKKKTGPTPVKAIVHPDKRANIPTADAQEFVTPEVEANRSSGTPAIRRWIPARVEGQGRADGDDLRSTRRPIYIRGRSTHVCSSRTSDKPRRPARPNRR